MKRILIAVLVFVAYFGYHDDIGTPAHATELDLSGQLLLAGSGSADLVDIAPETRLGLYAHGTFMYPIGADPMLFGYVGPELTIGDHNLKLLTGAFFGGGSSITTSLWYTVSDLWAPGLGLFAEFDAYFPVQGHGDIQFYGYATLTASVTEDITLGLEQEYFGDTDELVEAAFGPSLGIGKVVFWLAYDMSPAVEGDTIFLRISAGL